MADILMMALRLKLKKISEPGLTDYRSIWKVADEGKKSRKHSKTVFLNTVARLRFRCTSDKSGEVDWQPVALSSIQNVRRIISYVADWVPACTVIFGCHVSKGTFERNVSIEPGYDPALRTAALTEVLQ